MKLIVESASKIFDVNAIKKGDLVYAKHRTWTEGVRGFATSISEKKITVQYFPGIGNVSNHFFITADETAAGEWELRWSSDLKTINQYVMEGENEDDNG